MKKQYKTNFKCQGCISAVKDILQGNKKIKKWDVDLQSPDRILTVEWDIDDSEELILQIQKAGFQISQINN